MNKSTKQPTAVQGLTAIARLIATKFAIQCSKQYITKWLRASPEYPVPFPRADVNSTRFNVTDCFAWIEKYYIPNTTVVGEDLFKLAAEAKARQTIREDEQHKFDCDVERGKYILKTDHNAILSGLGSQTWNIVCEAIERGLIDKLENQLQTINLEQEVKVQIINRARKEHFEMVDEMQRNFAMNIESVKEVFPRESAK